MARPLRIERAGGWYHLTARGNERKPIYRDPTDRRHFCELLAETVATFRVTLHAYVLMDNHFHLVVELTEANLARAMQWLGVSYSVWFNRRHERTGHLFQGRYKAIVVDPVTWGLEVTRYVHLNPVRLGRLKLDPAGRAASRLAACPPPSPELVGQRLERLRAYRWSSYRAYVGLDAAPDWLTCQRVLELGGQTPEGSRRAYRQFVESAVRQGVAPGVWHELKGELILGGQEFVRHLGRELRGNAREQASLRQLRPRPGLERVIAAVAQLKGEPWEVFRDRYGDWGRDLVLYLGRKACALRLRELGQLAGGIDYGTVAAAVHRFQRRLDRDKVLAQRLQHVQAELQM